MEYILLIIGAAIVLFTYRLYCQECDRSSMLEESRDAWKDDYFKEKAKSRWVSFENDVLSDILSSVATMTVNQKKKKKVVVKKKNPLKK